MCGGHQHRCRAHDLRLQVQCEPLLPRSPALPTSRPALLCSAKCASLAADPVHVNICISPCPTVSNVSFNSVNSNQGNTGTDGDSLSEDLQKRREKEMRGAVLSSAKDRALSSVTGGLEETHRTLVTPCWKEAWIEWNGHRLSQAGSAHPWAQKPVLLSP